MSTAARRAVRSGWWAGLTLLATAACFHTHRVGENGKEDEDRGGNGRAAKTEQGSSPRVTNKRIPPRGDRPAVAASPEGMMNPGSARKIQQALQARGYLAEVSGELDVPTSAALRKFQSDHGLAATGAPDRETLRSLGVKPGDVYQTGTGARDGATGSEGGDRDR